MKTSGRVAWLSWQLNNCPSLGSSAWRVYLCRYILARLNPVLANVVDMSGQHALEVSAMPHGGVWPSTGVFIRVEPMRVLMEQSDIVREALDSVELGDR